MKNTSEDTQGSPNHQKDPKVKGAAEINVVSKETLLMESMCREKIAELTGRQENELQLIQEILDEHLAQMIELQDKRNLAKRSLKLAKKKKLAKSLIRMISDECKMLKANRRQLKGIIEEQKNNIKAKREAVELLKTLF